MSDTPRTDAAALGFARLMIDHEKYTTTELVDANFARQLERELRGVMGQRAAAIRHGDVVSGEAHVNQGAFGTVLAVGNACGGNWTDEGWICSCGAKQPRDCKTETAKL